MIIMKDPIIPRRPQEAQTCNCNNRTIVCSTDQGFMTRHPTCLLKPLPTFKDFLYVYILTNFIRKAPIAKELDVKNRFILDRYDIHSLHP